MSEWWTYRPSSFLLFSERTYHRLFELVNTGHGPAPVVAGLLGLALLVLLARGGERPERAALGLLAAAWLWVGWAFHLQRYAAIHLAATGFAAAFVVQGVLLLLASATVAARRAESPWRRHIGLGLVLLAVGAYPLLAPLAGRPWRQAELFGLAPDPTALATLGALLCLGATGPTHSAGTGAAAEAAHPALPARHLRRGWLDGLLWPLPVLWCGVTGLTLWAMNAPLAAAMPGLAVLALLARAGR